MRAGAARHLEQACGGGKAQELRIGLVKALRGQLHALGGQDALHLRQLDLVQLRGLRRQPRLGPGQGLRAGGQRVQLRLLEHPHCNGQLHCSMDHRSHVELVQRLRRFDGITQICLGSAVRCRAAVEIAVCQVDRVPT